MHMLNQAVSFILSDADSNDELNLGSQDRTEQMGSVIVQKWQKIFCSNCGITSLHFLQESLLELRMTSTFV